MTLLSDFQNDLSGIFDPTDGLGNAATLGGQSMNVLLRYDMDVDENGIRFEVMDLDVLRTDVDNLPEYRAEAVVDGATWYFWKQVSADAISRRLRFRKTQRFTSR